MRSQGRADIRGRGVDEGQAPLLPAALRGALRGLRRPAAAGAIAISAHDLNPKASHLFCLRVQQLLTSSLGFSGRFFRSKLLPSLDSNFCTAQNGPRAPRGEPRERRAGAGRQSRPRAGARERGRGGRRGRRGLDDFSSEAGRYVTICT